MPPGGGAFGDFQRDELAAHHITFDEAVECVSSLILQCGETNPTVIAISCEDKTKKLSEQEIDQVAAAQANDASAWEKPVRVRRTKTASLSIPADLAARAAFLAQLHRTRNVEE